MSFFKPKPRQKMYAPGDLPKKSQEFIRSAEKDFKNKFPNWPNQLPQQSGLFQSGIPEPPLDFVKAEESTVIRNGEHNCWIVLGRDRPSTLASGYGGKGAQRSNAIDLVVGRMSSVRGGKGPAGEDPQVNNSFRNDAARVYISQLTDIDKDFSLAGGKAGSAKERSGIGIKADGVRIIGREGVKIVTGGARPAPGSGRGLNSLGGDVRPQAPGIELIAGNNDGSTKTWRGMRNPGFELIPNLQPLVRGFNTRDSLREFSRIIDKIWASVYNFMILQSWFNGAVAITTWPPDTFQHGIMGFAQGALMPVWVGEPLYSARNEKMEWEVNYLEPFGYKYICSRNVRST